MVEPDDPWVEFATRLADMARDLLTQDDVGATLERICTHATELIEDCDEAGVLALKGKKVRTLAATSDTVLVADRLQEELGEGPCFDATRHREKVYRLKDMTGGHDRWPRFAPRAHELGMGSMMGFLLYTEDDNLGSLNMYSAKPSAFTEADERTGWLLASHAAVAFSSARRHDELQHAIATRHEIGEAMGILMGRHNLTEHQAFDVLRKASQDRNTKLREVASVVTRTGAPPE